MPQNAGQSPDWRRAIIPPTATVREAINNLNATALQVALIVDSDGSFLGILTDGDIRRCLLKPEGLDHSINDAIQRNPVVVQSGVNQRDVLALLRTKRLRHLPVLDGDRRLVGLHILEDLTGSPEVPNLLVVMAGGKGERLRPYTESCPKPMLLIDGRPILEHCLERAIFQGFKRFILSVHYLSNTIMNYFGNGERWGVEIDYLYEDQPLGTAGGLEKLDPVPDTSVVVTNGDVLTTIDYPSLLDFHYRHDASATMAVRIHEWQSPFGVVEATGLDIQHIEEKPQYRAYTIAGVYALQPEVLQLLDGTPCDMPDLFERIRSTGGRTIIFPTHEPWVDIGREKDYLNAQARGAAMDSLPFEFPTSDTSQR